MGMAFGHLAAFIALSIGLNRNQKEDAPGSRSNGCIGAG